MNEYTSIKRYISECGLCSLEMTKPLWQLMADLPAARSSSCQKAFAISGLDYFRHINYVEGRGSKKPWVLLLACMTSGALCGYCHLPDNEELLNGI